jgi:hypothetical protein
MRRDSGFVGGGQGGTSTHRADPGAWLSALSGIDPVRLDEVGALEAITALERLKRAAAATQARLSVRVDALARERQRREGVPDQRVGVGVGAQVASARMESPHGGSRDLGLAKVLVLEMQATLAGMADGRVSEWQATLVARETACLEVETRRAIDERIADRLAAWGDQQTVREVRKLAYAAEPGATVARHAQAVADRRVTLRPAPDTMCHLSALLPAAQGVAAYAALVRDADRAPAAGEGRGKGQVMADTLVERLTGQAAACDVPVEVELIMPAPTLLGQEHTPSHLVGYGPLPAAAARRLLHDTDAGVWLRRLFTHPDSGRLVAMDSHRRAFTGQLRHFVVLRDQFCRTPWCDAPIRHVDHVLPHHTGGPTTRSNAQGLCEACNYSKQAPGWHIDSTGEDSSGGPSTTLTTPTGRHYPSTAPDPPGTEPSIPRPPWQPRAPGVWSIRPRAG